MLKRVRGATSNGKLQHLFISSKTATLVPEFVVVHTRPYRLQLLQFLKPGDLVARKNFCMEMQHTLVNYGYLFCRFIFSDEASFHLSGKVNRHYMRIWRRN